MRSTLFLIPFQVGGVPLFGWGLLLAGWAAGCLVVFGWLLRRYGFGRETADYLPVMVMLGAVIYFLPSFFEDLGGVPIRGYGIMVLLGVVSGIGIVSWRARRMGLNPEVIISVCFWMIIAGILTARLFYVLEYWEQDFHRATLGLTLKQIVNYTQGGLVIYGALIGGAAAFFWYVHRNRLPALALADLIAPGVMLGLAIGRIGCFMNGCCYGGLSEHPWAVAFPKPNPPYILSPPYEHQAARGQLFGFSLADDPEGVPQVVWVQAKTRADQSGLRVGDRFRAINEIPVARNKEAYRILSQALFGGEEIDIRTTNGHVRIPAAPPPEYSLTVHPAQLYSAVHAGALMYLLWVFYPFRQRDGQVFALMITVYPIGRFLLESIRVDEPGRLGTPLSISQWISIATLAVAVGFWFFLQKQPARLALPPETDIQGPKLTDESG
ncbi:MAG: prolipoprotein diacylglyceryl transferase [Pirellulales bacterium]|nr:prolipoprotein diacylglyceryl transferase [Pirellulales bacterium]